MEGGTNVSAEYLSKRLHSREEETDDSFLKRLRTIEHKVPSHSKLVVRLGPRAEKYTFRVAVCRLLTQSMKLADIIGSELEEDGNFKGSAVARHGKHSDLVIDLLDFQCDGEILRIVEDFCDSDDPSMEESIISASNVVRLFHAGKFLQIESLTFAALAYLDKHVFNSWEKCLNVLATFNCIDVSSGDTNLDNTHAPSMEADTGGEDTLFDVCLKVFLRKMEVKHPDESITIGCNADCLTQVAQLLHPNVAILVYQSCRASNFGLFLKHAEGSPDLIRIIGHSPKDSTCGPPLQRFLVVDSRQDTLKWIERLSDLVGDLSRRALLVLHFSKMMRLTDLTGNTLTYIKMDFLCGLLVQASQLVEATREKGSASGLFEEILFLTKLVAQDLQLCCGYNQWTLFLFTRFNFGTLLSIVKHFKCEDSAENIVHVAKLVDACIQEHVKDRSFTIEQALMVYTEFPNNLRRSHVDFYQLMASTLSPPELHELTTLLDYEKLPADTIKKFCTDLKLGCDSRFVEIQVLKQKNHCDALTVNKLRIDLNLRTEELQRVRAKLRSELRLRTADFVQLRVEKELEEEKLKDELKRATEVQNSNNEELAEMRDALAEAKSSSKNASIRFKKKLKSIRIQRDEAVQSKKLAENERDETVQAKKLAESERDEAVQAKKLAENERDMANHSLEEEKQKIICQICFLNPRDTMCLPCTHFHYCSECLQQHHERQKTCPTCRGFTSGVMKCNLAL